MSEQKNKTQQANNFSEKAKLASKKFRTIRKMGRYLSMRRQFQKKGVALRNGEEIEF